MQHILLCISAFILLLTGGCTSDSLFFSTKTAVGIDISATNGSPRVNVGYDRTEAAIVPVKANGSAHSVLGGIDADLSLNQVRIKQLFATGEAAKIVAVKIKPNGSSPPGSDSISEQKTKNANQSGGNSNSMKMGMDARQPIVFATDASFSLINIQLDSNGLPGSGSTLYRRSEATLIPIKPDQSEVASVYADISIDTSSVDENKLSGSPSWVEEEVGHFPTRFSGFGVRIVQSFATGDAAEKLVQRPEIMAKLEKVVTANNPGHTDLIISQAKISLREKLNTKESSGKVKDFFDWMQAAYPNSNAGDYKEKEDKPGDYFDRFINPRLSRADFIIVNNKAQEMLK